MRRPSVFVLLIAALLLVGVATAIVAAADGSAAPALVGVGLALLAGATYVADRRTQTARKSLELRLEKGIEATRQDLAAARKDLPDVATREDLAEVAERLDRLDARLDTTQRRLVASSDAARLEAAERESRMRPAL
ncbi:hypothetical protein APR04_003395 [Promicromonospora umidemergens]|nr:hypothetical protein [Promicromonospora umidemergens]MCP2284474.1 hypothetical protein [Promicromonospora umidemergens]